MFELNGTRIRLTAGDTGILTIKAQIKHVFTDADRALFTARKQNGALLAEMTLQPEPDGTVMIPFTHSLSEKWKPGEYSWDIRFAIDAVFDGGRVVDGTDIITPMRPGVLQVLGTEGRI